MKKIISIVIFTAFMASTIRPPVSFAYANDLNLPVPGTMVNLSPVYEPTLIKGLTVHKDNPFLFDFIVDTGNSKLTGEALKAEGDRLVKYFFACLTIPEKDLWVNLSPYEKSRMIPQALGETAMGQDLLAQDYILKQLTASLIDPEKNLGRAFWDRVYTKSRQMFGTVQIPVNTFNKVWILADEATVFEHNQTAFVIKKHLKVMLEEDYLAMQKHSVALPSAPRNDTHSIGANIMRAIIIPEIEKEVNTGKNFAQLRQIFNSLILASWYKKNLKEALLTQVYADKSTVSGVNESTAKQSGLEIYEQYLKAYKKGVFNFIKEDTDPLTKQLMPRKYFSGGFEVSAAMLHTETALEDPAEASVLVPTGSKYYDMAAIANPNAAVPSIPSAAMTARDGVIELMFKTINPYIYIFVGEKHERALAVTPKGELDSKGIEIMKSLIDEFNILAYHKFHYDLEIVSNGDQWGVIFRRGEGTFEKVAGHLLFWLRDQLENENNKDMTIDGLRTQSLPLLENALAYLDYKRFKPTGILNFLNLTFGSGNIVFEDVIEFQNLPLGIKPLTSEGFISKKKVAEWMEDRHKLYKIKTNEGEFFVFIKTLSAAMIAEKGIGPTPDKFNFGDKTYDDPKMIREIYTALLVFRARLAGLPNRESDSESVLPLHLDFFPIDGIDLKVWKAIKDAYGIDVLSLPHRIMIFQHYSSVERLLNQIETDINSMKTIISDADRMQAALNLIAEAHDPVETPQEIRRMAHAMAQGLHREAVANNSVYAVKDFPEHLPSLIFSDKGTEKPRLSTGTINILYDGFFHSYSELEFVEAWADFMLKPTGSSPAGLSLFEQLKAQLPNEAMNAVDPETALLNFGAQNITMETDTAKQVLVKFARENPELTLHAFLNMDRDARRKDLEKIGTLNDTELKDITDIVQELYEELQADAQADPAMLNSTEETDALESLIRYYKKQLEMVELDQSLELGRAGNPYNTNVYWKIVHKYASDIFYYKNEIQERERKLRKVRSGMIGAHAAEQADQAVLAHKVDHSPMAGQGLPLRGGIDLSTQSGFRFEKDADGGVKMDFDPAMIARIRREGVRSVVPVIIRIVPMVSVLFVLGLAPIPAASQRRGQIPIN